MGCYFEKQSIQHAFIQFGCYLARPLGLEIRYWPDRTDRNMGIGQTEQTKIWVLATPSRPKYGYWQDRTDLNMGIRQTKQTKIAIGQTEGATQIFSRPLWTVARTPLSATQVGLANTCLWLRTSSRGAEILKLKKLKRACTALDESINMIAQLSLAKNSSFP